MNKPIKRLVLPTRMQGGSIDDMGSGVWRIWLHTVDFVFGTFLVLHPDGCIERYTVREDEGDEIITVKSANT